MTVAFSPIVISRRPYGTIYADPPWHYHGMRRDLIHASNGERHFPVMSEESLRSLPVRNLVGPESHLYLWPILKTVDQAIRVMESWGFSYYSAVAWCKPGLGMGPWRNNSELLLIGTFGEQFQQREWGYKTVCRLGFKGQARGTWHNLKRQAHAVKPDFFYDLIESMSNGPYLELFARRRRSGWIQWGNELSPAESNK